MRLGIHGRVGDGESVPNIGSGSASSFARWLTPLGWGHVNPHGLFRLDMAARLPLDVPASPTD